MRHNAFQSPYDTPARQRDRPERETEAERDWWGLGPSDSPHPLLPPFPTRPTPHLSPPGLTRATQGPGSLGSPTPAGFTRRPGQRPASPDLDHLPCPLRSPGPQGKATGHPALLDPCPSFLSQSASSSREARAGAALAAGWGCSATPHTGPPAGARERPS